MLTVLPSSIFIVKMPSESQIIGGHKANLHNPNTSDEAKAHSKEVLKDEYNSE